MSTFLTQAVQTVLDAHPAGLTEREIRRALIERSGLRCIPREGREILLCAPTSAARCAM
ncbi:MAG: hypothetical protein N2508_14695 [Anaerolineae bacterium]|nr:hypothetical protein [Anaerolineae bacterium]